MKKTLISAAVAAALLAGPAMAQTMTLEQIQQQIADLKAQNERLEAEVDYLKQNAKGERKENATKAVVLENLSTTAAKFVWSGDFRYRDEEISTAANNTASEHTRSRQRARLRFGVLAKVNDTINARVQFSTTNSGNDISRSTNQTFGTGWDRKPLSIDLAYVDWKINPMFNLQLGKTPLPWVTTVSYFFDKDLTPEGAALKFNKGIFFAGAYYDWLNERNSATSQGASTDAKMYGAQGGIKLPIGKSTLTAAVGYFDLKGVKDRIATGTGTGCTIDGTFGAGLGTADNSFGNSTYLGTNVLTGSGTSCTRLLSDFNVMSALVQFDFLIGKFPVSTFVDYMKNNGAFTNVESGKKLDTAYAVGVTFNKAAAAKTWEASLVYEKNGKDAVFAQFVDSDFGAGTTDAKGWALKGAYVPATNWTLNATYFINTLNNQGLPAGTAVNATNFAALRDLDYKRLQLDANYKF